jgi:hypothetical protein
VTKEGVLSLLLTFDSNMDWHVKILSDFRDKWLANNYLGKRSIALYKKFSPPIADFLSGHSFARAVVRYALVPITGIASISLSIHPLALLCTFFVLLLGGVYCFKRSAVSTQRSAM